MINPLKINVALTLQFIRNFFQYCSYYKKVIKEFKKFD